MNTRLTGAQARKRAGALQKIMQRNPGMNAQQANIQYEQKMANMRGRRANRRAQQTFRAPGRTRPPVGPGAAPGARGAGGGFTV